MGVMLTPTPDMGPWHVEVRAESAYLYGENPNWTPADGPEPQHALHARILDPDANPDIAIPVEELDAVIAALQQIMSHSAYRDWCSTHEQDTLPWAADRRGDKLEITGPVILYGIDSDHPGWQHTGTIELVYDDLAGLLDTLTDARK